MNVKAELWEEEEKGRGAGCSLDGGIANWELCLEAFISFLQAGIFRKVSGKGLQWNIYGLSRCIFNMLMCQE